MNENTDVEILPPEALEPEIEFLEATPRKRFGLAGILATAFLASALGAGAMYLVAEFLKTPAPTVNLVPLTERVDALNTENKTLKAQLTRLQRDMKASPKPLAVDLSGIETRLERLEAAKPQALDPDLIARLEALKEGGSEALDLSDILARIEALETRPVERVAVPIETPNVAAVPTAQTTSIIPFPKAKILAAIDKADRSQGWLKRSLKKHISVQSEDNPRYLVELAGQNIEAGNLDAAIAAFDKLPAEAKAVATEWRNSVESN